MVPANPIPDDPIPMPAKNPPTASDCGKRQHNRSDECKAGADKLLPNQGAIDAMAAKYGGRTIDGLARKFGDGQVHVISLAKRTTTN